MKQEIIMKPVTHISLYLMQKSKITFTLKKGGGGHIILQLKFVHNLESKINLIQFIKVMV